MMSKSFVHVDFSADSRDLRTAAFEPGRPLSDNSPVNYGVLQERLGRLAAQPPWWRQFWELVVLAGLGLSSPALAGPAAPTMLDAGTLSRQCYATVGSVLQSAGGSLTPRVRKAYLDWAEETVLEKLRQSHQAVPENCLAEARQDGTLRDALFGSVFPPDPSILQNYAQLCAELGEGVLAKYRSLVIAISVAKRIKGVEESGTSKDIGRDYQPGFWVDSSLQAPSSEAEKDFIRRIANYMKQSHVSAIDLFQNGARQQQLREDLATHNVPSGLIAEVNKSIPFGERLKNAMVLLGQRPAAREPKPVTNVWLRHLVAIYEARPTSTPTVNGKALPWPLFPLDKAPWPLLMPLAHPVPLSEAKYIWEKFLGKHGPNGYQDYGPYRAGEDGGLAIISDELRPSKWFWDAWPDVMVHGGACVPLSKATVELYSALGKPAMWAGQPGHSNVISFQCVGEAWTAEVEQGATGGPDVTTGEWYFDEDPGTQLRFRDLYYWPFSEYHLGLALGMNVGLKSYMDTRVAEKLFGVLPTADKPTLGVKLLRSALKANPCNPAIWYRLAEQTSDAREGADLAAAAREGDPGRLFSHARGKERRAVDASVQARISDYWHTIAPFVAQYTVLSQKHRLLINQVARAIPADLITVTVSSVFSDDQLARHLVDGAGMTMGALHDNAENATTMWQTVNRPETRPAAQGLPPSPAWVRFDFAQPQSFETILIWNHNQANLTDRGFRMTRIYGSIDGITWEPLTSSPTTEVPRASGSPAAEPTAVPNTSAGQRFKSVIIAAEATDGNYGGDCYGLSAIRFVQSAAAAAATTAAAETPAAVGTQQRPAETPPVQPDVTGVAPWGPFKGNDLDRVIPANLITVSASTVFSDDQLARHLVDGSGMTGARHDNDGDARSMWHTVNQPETRPAAQGLPLTPAWVRFDFARPQTFETILIWNHNQANLTDRGFRKTRIYGSADGVRWDPLTSPPIIELPRAGGSPGTEPIAVPTVAAGRPLASVIIAAAVDDGNYGGDCYGLSAVRFVPSAPAAQRAVETPAEQPAAAGGVRRTFSPQPDPGPGAQAGADRLWPVQAMPRALVRTGNQQEFPAPRGAYQMLVQSVAGLAAQAVNEDRGDEMVWVATDNVDVEAWYARLRQRNPQLEIRGGFGPWELARRYVKKGLIKGYILYKFGDSAGSANVATSLAGLLHGILVDESLEKEAQGLGLQMLLDARDKSSAWCFETYKRRFNRRLLCIQDPNNPAIRDLAIAQKALAVYGYDAPVPAAMQWLTPLSPMLGWNGGDEFTATHLATSYGHLRTATNWCMNLPVLMAGSERVAPPRPQCFDPRKIDWSDTRSAVSFMLSDGDNVQWLQTNFFGNNKDYWASPDRGTIPFGWSCCFSQLAQLCPPSLDYAAATQSAGDSFIEMGGGYYYPDLFAFKRPDRWEVLARHARRTWEMMKRNNTRIIGCIVNQHDSPDALKAYQVFAGQTDGLLAMLVLQYNPYNAGLGRVFWVTDRNGIDVPVITARYVIWNNQGATPARVARNIRETVEKAGPAQCPCYDWVIVHAWSYFRKAAGDDDNAEDMPQDDAPAHGGLRGYTPVTWCAQRLPPSIRVICPEELAWCIRMKHNVQQTQSFLRDLPPIPPAAEPAPTATVQPEETGGGVREISPKQERGLSLGQLRAGSAVRLQYVSGKWKAWGKVPSSFPDDPKEQGRNRLAIVNAPESGPVETLAIVPPETAAWPFEFTVPRDLENVALRINDCDGSWAKNPDGHVKYRVTVLGPR